MPTTKPNSEPKVENAPEGTRQGAWEVADGRVRFALWAPFKKSVALIGDFNDWDADADLLMVGEDGVWWCEKELDSGEHRYVFVVDGDTFIGDPYAREVDWTGDGPHAIVRVGEEPFEWHDGDYQMPSPERWVIYEVHVGDFTPEGTFAAMTERLDYLADLGVNAIELMPIFEYPGDQSWGYNPVYTMAPERAYGSLRDLKSLVDEAHARGLAVVLDMVLNHVAHDHPFAQLYPYDENPFFGTDENPWGFPDLNHWSDATKGYVHQIQRYWLEDLHIDGFRYDAAAFIGDDGLDGMSFIAHDAREIKPFVRLIGEYIPEEPGQIASTELNAGWHESWHRTLKAQLREGEFEGIGYGDMEALQKTLYPQEDGYEGGLNVVNYTESHDHERVIVEVRRNPEAAERALAKSLLGAAMLLTAPGTPMLLHGQELAVDAPKEDTMEGAKLPWERLEHDDSVKWLFERYKRLIWLRREHPALVTERVEVWLADPESRVLIYRRSIEGEDAEVIVMLNFSPDEQGFSMELPRSGRYREVIEGQDWDLDEGLYESVIPGSTARVLERVSDA